MLEDKDESEGDRSKSVLDERRKQSPNAVIDPKHLKSQLLRRITETSDAGKIEKFGQYCDIRSRICKGYGEEINELLGR